MGCQSRCSLYPPLLSSLHSLDSGCNLLPCLSKIIIVKVRQVVCPAEKLPIPLLPIASQPCPKWYAQPRSYQIQCFPLLPKPLSPVVCPAQKLPKPLFPIASRALLPVVYPAQMVPHPVFLIASQALTPVVCPAQKLSNHGLLPWKRYHLPIPW